jgi:hypothetical protein
MKIVICGNPQAGQQDLYSLLTGVSLEQIRLKPMEVQVGVCEVKDSRIDKLNEIYNPKKTAYTKIEYSLLPDFVSQGPTKNLIFTELKNADEICYVARTHEDIANFISELIIFDMMLTEKRLESIEKDQRKKYMEIREKEIELMQMCKKQLDAEKPLSQLAFNEDQIKALKPYQFLSFKPTVIVVNVGEDQIKNALTKDYPYPTIQICAELEAEINSLAGEEKAEFLKEMGIEEPALNKMTRVVYEGLGLISFFTVGADEVRAWPTKKNSTAPEAGAAIHSDIQKGFVCAELMKYDDLISNKSEVKLKELGKFYLKGRDYIVEDGDVLSFRFNV